MKVDNEAALANQVMPSEYIAVIDCGLIRIFKNIFALANQVMTSEYIAVIDCVIRMLRIGKNKTK